MARQTIDPGFGTKYQKRTKRIVNKNGSFNVIREGLRYSTSNVYQSLINMRWAKFLFMILSTYIVVNLLFAAIYFTIGPSHIAVDTSLPRWEQFMFCFYMSCQTITTLGYGVLHSTGHLSSLVSAFESMLGLISFALATGLLYGRFSKPRARIIYSDNLLVSPYRDGWSLQFKIANGRSNMLINMEVQVMLILTEFENGSYVRKYYTLPLERNSVLFMPLSWTIVHPFDEKSPLNGKSTEELIQMDAEMIVLITGFDDTFSQTVHSRYSYLMSDLIWGAKFEPSFETTDKGEVILHVDRINDWSRISSELK